VVIIEDHPMFAQLLADFINDQDGYQTVGIAHCGASGLRLSASARADVVVLDLGMPGSNGLDVLRGLRTEQSHIHVLIFSANLTSQFIKEALRLGAEGVLEKSAPFEDFIRALKLVSQGKTYLGQSASGTLRDMVKTGVKNPMLQGFEIKVLHMIIEGRKPKEIAARNGMSTAMVYSMLSKIRQQLGANSIQDLTLMAFRHGLYFINEPQTIPVSPTGDSKG